MAVTTCNRDRETVALSTLLESMEDDEGEASTSEGQLLRTEGITRKSVLEHPFLAPRLDEIYAKVRLQNPTLPSTLEKFVNSTLDGERGSAFIVNGKVKWQKALFDGLQDARAKAWLRIARKRDAQRVKEMSGEWILAEPPWWTNFQRPCWQVAIRLRYGLEVNPAIGPNIAPYCLARKMDGTYCLAQLDPCGQHAQICKVEGANIHRHDTVGDGIIPELKQHVTTVKKEQFIYELSQLNDDTRATSEARMDIFAEMPQFRAMLDIRVFLSTLASQWKSTRAHEIEKHNRYVTHQDGRRCTNVKLYAAVVKHIWKSRQVFCGFLLHRK